MSDKKIASLSSFPQIVKHADLLGKTIHFIAYHASYDNMINHGNQIHMSLNLNDSAKAEHVFNELQIEVKFIIISKKENGAILGDVLIN